MSPRTLDWETDLRRGSCQKNVTPMLNRYPHPTLFVHLQYLDHSTLTRYGHQDYRCLGCNAKQFLFFWGGGSHLPQRTKAAHATKMLLLLPQYTPSHPSRLLSYYSDLSTARWTDHTSCELHWPFTRRLCNIIQSLCSVLFCSVLV